MTTPNSSTAPSINLHADVMAFDEDEATSDMVGQTDDYTEWLPTKRVRPCNVGRTEQKIRLVTGGALAAAAFIAPVSRSWRILFGALAAAEIVTGAMRYCPLSQALGVNTCRGDEA
jgi:hypothetical protein